jgi:hypothetical protein
MKKTLLSLIVLCYGSMYAQITFDKGYFISNNGKRTECYIENMDWRNNPTSFTYKSALADTEVKTENIMGVLEFGIDNQSMYKRFDVNVERSQTVTSYLQKSKNPVWKSEIIFLHALVTGEANLYNYVDGNITKYFYETKKTPIEQLVYIKYMGGPGFTVGPNSYSESIQYNNQFRQQLLNNVNCGMTEKDFKSLDYNRNTLVKHFLAYNACAGTTTAAKASTNYDAISENRESFSLRILAGAYSSKVSISDPHTYYNKSIDISQMIFKFGFEGEYILPFNRGSWSVIASPVYQKFSPTKNYIGYINNPGFANDGEPVHYTAKVDYTSIEVPIGFRRYFFINKNSKITVSATYLVDLAGKGTIEITNSDGLANANDKFEIKSRNNLALGVGYMYKRFSGELRYNFPRQLSERLSWNITYTSVGLNLGYKIF